MAAYALLKRNPNPTLAEIKAGMANNLCRCTGYNTIIESVQYAVEKTKAGS
jgi:carbon-monoxide dehydrogenase small subunit